MMVFAMYDFQKQWFQYLKGPLLCRRRPYVERTGQEPVKNLGLDWILLFAQSGLDLFRGMGGPKVNKKGKRGGLSTYIIFKISAFPG